MSIKNTIIFIQEQVKNCKKQGVNRSEPDNKEQAQNDRLWGGSIGSWNLGDRPIVATLVLVAVLWKEGQLIIKGYVRKWHIPTLVVCHL